jgi:hypothetical protein
MKNIKHLTLTLTGALILISVYTHTSVKDLTKGQKIEKIQEEIKDLPEDKKIDKALELGKKYGLLDSDSDIDPWLRLALSL